MKTPRRPVAGFCLCEFSGSERRDEIQNSRGDRSTLPLKLATPFVVAFLLLAQGLFSLFFEIFLCLSLRSYLAVDRAPFLLVLDGVQNVERFPNQTGCIVEIEEIRDDVGIESLDGLLGTREKILIHPWQKFREGPLHSWNECLDDIATLTAHEQLPCPHEHLNALIVAPVFDISCAVGDVCFDEGHHFEARKLRPAAGLVRTDHSSHLFDESFRFRVVDLQSCRLWSYSLPCLPEVIPVAVTHDDVSI